MSATHPDDTLRYQLEIQALKHELAAERLTHAIAVANLNRQISRLTPIPDGTWIDRVRAACVACVAEEGGLECDVDL